MTNAEIDKSVRLLADEYLKGIKKTCPQDVVVIEAALGLVSGLLQNINDIARAARIEANLHRGNR